MKIFRCDNCGHALFFENVRCLRCGSALAFLPDRLALCAIEPVPPDRSGLWRRRTQRAPKERPEPTACATTTRNTKPATSPWRRRTRTRCACPAARRGSCPTCRFRTTASAGTPSRSPSDVCSTPWLSSLWSEKVTNPFEREAGDFDQLVEQWIPLTLLLNSLNSSLGQDDAYPFALTTQALDKLRFVHDVIQSPRADGAQAPAQSSCQTEAAQEAAPATTPA
jgi:hypothetical protein